MTTTKAITKKGILLDVASPTADEERMFEFLNSRVIGQKEASMLVCASSRAP